MSLHRRLSPWLVILDADEGYFIQTSYGLLVKPSEVKSIIDGLQSYCDAYTDEEIEAYNESYEKNLFSNKTEKKQTTKNSKSGYVYMLKCADKYKIGFSVDVENRIKQLDTRPFELKLLFKVYSDSAYQIEQELHKRLILFKETGEWYSDISKEMIVEMIEEIARYLKCEIQY